MSTATLVTLTSLRWNLPILADLGETGRAGFSALQESLGVCRDSLARSLRALAEPGWVRRREGYELTRPGWQVARPGAELVELARVQGLESVVLKKWTLPVANALRGWSLSFAELRALLPDITPRALTLALKEMAAQGLLNREVVGGFPPSAAYRLTDLGVRYLPALERLP